MIYTFSISGLVAIALGGPVFDAAVDYAAQAVKNEPLFGMHGKPDYIVSAKKIQTMSPVLTQFIVFWPQGATNQDNGRRGSVSTARRDVMKVSDCDGVSTARRDVVRVSECGSVGMVCKAASAQCGIRRWCGLLTRLGGAR